MALEYQLYLTNEIHSKDIVLIFSKLGWQFFEEKISSQSTPFQIINPEIGFSLSLINFEVNYDINGEQLDFTHAINFRIDKMYISTLYKENMLAFLTDFINKINIGFLFLFNGEIILMLRNKQNEIILSDSDFWSNDLIKKLDNIKHRKEHFDTL
jgi:hypothetical protein